MNRPRIHRWTPNAALGLLACLTSCLAPGSAPPIRYFLPGTPAAVATGALDEVDAVDATAAELGLELTNLRADAHLDERMLLRSSDVEAFPDELNRWLSRPSVFVEQNLRRVLFATDAFTERSGADRLRVVLRSYEANLPAPAEAVVAWECILDHGGRSHSTYLRESVALADTRPESIARAIGVAQERCARATLAWVERVAAIRR